MTALDTRCTQPGCDGVIEGGYCNVCGLAEASALNVLSQRARIVVEDVEVNKTVTEILSKPRWRWDLTRLYAYLRYETTSH